MLKASLGNILPQIQDISGDIEIHMSWQSRNTILRRRHEIYEDPLIEKDQNMFQRRPHPRAYIPDYIKIYI